MTPQSPPHGLGVPSLAHLACLGISSLSNHIAALRITTQRQFGAAKAHSSEWHEDEQGLVIRSYKPPAAETWSPSAQTAEPSPWPGSPCVKSPWSSYVCLYRNVSLHLHSNKSFACSTTVRVLQLSQPPSRAAISKRFLHNSKISRTTMRAQVLEAFNQPYQLKEITKPSHPQGHDLLVKVEAASYCHTDAVFASGAMWQDLPRIGSHEFAGTILAMGDDVSPSLNLKVGLPVGVPGRAFHPCGACYECIHNDGDPERYGVWCNKAGNLGLSADGGFQEYCVVDSRQVAPRPQNLSAVDTAPLMCAGLTIWNALQTAKVKMEPGGGNGKMIAISGAGGGLGHLGVQFAVKLGCKVIAIDTSDAALALLDQIVKGLGPLGQNVTIVDARKQSAEDVRVAVCGTPKPTLEGEKGADAALILPESQKALEYGMKLLRSHSVCVTVSFPIDGFHIQPRDLVFRHISMVGVLVGRNRQLRAMLNFAAEHGVRAKVTKYKLEDLNQLVTDYHKGASGKLVVDMSQ